MNTISKIRLEEVKEGFNTFNFQIKEDHLNNSLDIPIIIIKSKKKGPKIVFTSLIHGDEFNGLFVSQKLIEKLKEGINRGVIIIVPAFNYPGFLKGERNFGKVDLNHIMPGKDKGLIQNKYVHRIFNEIIVGADYLIDLHAARKDSNNIYHIRANIDDDEIKKVALMLNSDLIINHKPTPTTLRGAAEEIGVKSLTLELGDSLVFQEYIVNTAYEGILSFLVKYNMINEVRNLKKVKPIICNDSYRVFVKEAGLVNIFPNLLDNVKKNQRIGEIKDIFGNIVEKIKAPEEGIVISKVKDPLVKDGTRIILIGKNRK